MKNAIASLLFCCVTLTVALQVQAQSPKVTDFARDVAPLLAQKCLSCHGENKAENGFVVTDRKAMLGFIEAGNAAASSLWTDYLTQPSRDHDQTSLVMPPNGPLAAEQLALIKLWIDEGASWPEEVSIGKPKSAATDLGARLYRFIGYFHPAMVHFPIALFLAGGFCAFLSYFLGPKCQSTAFQCVAVAALTSIVTVVMGWSFADTQGYPAWDKPLLANATHRDSNLFFHRWLGTLTAALGVTCVLVALLARRYKSVRLSHLWRILAIVLAGLVAVVGHQGGELVYGEIFDNAMKQLFP